MTAKGIFGDVPDDFEATRYHSLIVERDSLPDSLEITAETDDGIIMGLQPQDEAGPWRAVPSRKHCLRARPHAIEELPRPRGGARMTDLKPLIAKAANGEALTRDGGARGLRHPDVGRSDAGADRRLPHGAAGARRDGRRDHRRGRDHAREDDAGRSARRRDRHRRHRRRCVGLLQHLDLRRLRRRRRRPQDRQARQPRAVVEIGRRRCADRARRQDRSHARADQPTASPRPASASCSRPPITPR